jgi:hypothetical protein
MENPDVAEEITKAIYSKVKVVAGNTLGHIEDSESSPEES